ncbi:hypothetical protein MTR_6g079500 [Medicago truncatula]|uniref:Uncharacterized protein n=1 Tax=Medicago truncatula TaxID=3880 RepID=A0A072UBV3_MEDTR|nr:hypothetical protein MTR_6g079500 [Medicago truncatula]
MVRRQGGWRLGVGGRSVSSWWKEVAKIRDGVGEDDGGWFAGRVSKWLGDVPFNRRFARLFDLTTDKMCTVADMSRLGWEEGGEAWVWRRRLWAWEEETVEECRSLLDNVLLRLNVLDRWQWDPDIIDGYTVRGVYQILTTSVSNTIVKTDELVWHEQVPLKVSIVARRLLKDRLWNSRIDITFVLALRGFQFSLAAYSVLVRYIWSRSSKLRRSLLSVYSLFRLFKGSKVVSSIDLAALRLALVDGTK